MFSFLMNFFKTNTVDKIISRLWLGDYRSALDIDFLLKNKINLIINCTSNTKFFYETTDLNLLNSNTATKLRKIETYRIPVNDSLLEADFLRMEKYFKIVIPLLLRKYTIENKNILVHCYAGKQRSAIVVAALLKVLSDNNYISVIPSVIPPVIPSVIPSVKKSNLSKYTRNIQQYQNICNYIISKRYQAFTYGYRVNFEQTFLRYFKIR